MTPIPCARQGTEKKRADNTTSGILPWLDVANLEMKLPSVYSSTITHMEHHMRVVVGPALILCAASASAQGPDATILKEPVDWRFERLPVPAPFAPDIRLIGFEEARFAPGMFNTSSPNYFTYVMVIAADGSPELGQPGIEEFLQKYYRGLSVGVGRRKGLTPDPAQMTAQVVPMS